MKRVGLGFLPALLCCAWCMPAWAQQDTSCSADCASDKTQCRRAASHEVDNYRNPPFTVTSDHAYPRHAATDMTTTMNEDRARQEAARGLLFNENRSCKAAEERCLRGCARDSLVYQKR